MSNKRVDGLPSNPFSDNQAKNYTDKKVVNEFCPISNFWDLFNDQHEILLGNRGCGKTVLLKMMRFSMLNKLSHQKAKELVQSKNYISFYVSMQLEYIKKLSQSELKEDVKLSWFRFSFNCILAQSIIRELAELINDIFVDSKTRVKIECEIVEILESVWLIDKTSKVYLFKDLRKKVSGLFYGVNPFGHDWEKVPSTFTHSIASVLTSINVSIGEILNISPTWIVCIDEAEFVDECYQKCINSAIRSNTNNVTFKMATLPFYHTTKQTLDKNINIMNGQDFRYIDVNMDYDKDDFVNVTNSIVKTRFGNKIGISKLDEFVETIGNDNYIDYYAKEVGTEKSSRINLEKDIFNQLSKDRRDNNKKKTSRDIRKSIYDKLAPVFYIREMKIRKKGNYMPGWYAGATMVRRIAQGNPRIFIRIMSEFYNKAKGKKLPLTLKMQSKTLWEFSKAFCEETSTLEQVGREVYGHLEYIADKLSENTHRSNLTQSGVSFKFKYDINIKEHFLWIQKAVAFSRLYIDDNSLKTQISTETIFRLANIYAVKYWLPMRLHASPTRIGLSDDIDLKYIIKRPDRRKKQNEESGRQITFSIGDTINGNSKH